MGVERNTGDEIGRVVSAIEAAWESGCPVASAAEKMAPVAVRRAASVHRRLGGSPDREQRIEDLAKGLRDRFEGDRRLVGPLMEDYRYLAAKIVDALE
jgi:hypothetical protein